MSTFKITINNNSVNCRFKIPNVLGLQKFGHKVYAYLEIDLDNLQISGNANISIKWPSEIYKYIINPSSLMFEIDDKIINQHSVSLDINETTTIHVISIPNNSEFMKIYIFSDIISKINNTVISYIGGVEKGNKYYSWLLPANTVVNFIEKCKNETEAFNFINAKPYIINFNCNKIRMFNIEFSKPYRSISGVVNLYTYCFSSTLNANITIGNPTIL